MAGCGSGTHSTVTVTTPASTNAGTYLGPSCSQMDASNSEGYSMCDDSDGSPCPTGWNAMTGQPGACQPDSSSNTASTDTSTDTTQASTDTTSTDTAPPSGSWGTAAEAGFMSQCDVTSGGSESTCRCLLT